MILDYITLENNINYAVVNTLIVNENKYLFLANENDETDDTIRKVIKKDNKEYITKLDNEDEFSEVMDEFLKKYRMEDNSEE